MMKLWSLPVVTAFILAPPLSASAQTRTPPSKPAQAKGHANVVCNPSCDDVVIAGRSYGPSPLVRVELPVGTHEVTLKRKTQADKRVQIVVTAGEVVSSSFTLTTQSAPTATPPDVAARIARFAKTVDGWLNVQCDPKCDEVLVDGKRPTGRDMTNLALPPGEHEITGKRKGAPDKIIKVRVVEGQTSAVRLGVAMTASGTDDAATRALLEKKIAGGAGTVDDAKQLLAICTKQGDKACREKVEALLRPKPSR